MTNEAFVTKWVIDTVKKDYADDIALVVSHTTLGIDADERVISYFVPVTERGYQFGRTFILDGRGFDIWGVDWNRLERFACLEEYNLTCLANGEILYARSEEDAKRFEDLKKQQLENLADPELSRKCALTAYNEAKGLYLDSLFAGPSDAKMCVGYTLDFLARAIAFTNHRYFMQSQMAQMTELAAMENVPEGFIETYRDILNEPDTEAQKRLCFDALRTVHEFLEAQPSLNTESTPNTNFQELSDWYAELSYTWLRLRRYAKKNDTVRVYMWGIMLQNELDSVCDDFGLERMNLMERYRTDKLDEFVAYADALEARIRKAIVEGGGVIHEYKSVEEFLNEV